MIKIAIGDWFLARSEAFKILLTKFKEHKVNTINSFSRVKARHREYTKKINEHESRIKQLENIFLTLQTPIKIKRIRKTK